MPSAYFHVRSRLPVLFFLRFFLAVFCFAVFVLTACSGRGKSGEDDEEEEEAEEEVAAALPEDDGRKNRITVDGASGSVNDFLIGFSGDFPEFRMYDDSARKSSGLRPFSPEIARLCTDSAFYAVLFPVGGSQIRCRIADTESGAVLADEVLPLDRMPGLFARTAEKARSGHVRGFSIETKNRTAAEYGLRYLLTRSFASADVPAPAPDGDFRLTLEEAEGGIRMAIIRKQDAACLFQDTLDLRTGWLDALRGMLPRMAGAMGGALLFPDGVPDGKSEADICRRDRSSSTATATATSTAISIP